jgi:hypothetical protein
VDVEYFIKRWTSREGGAERANYQMFLSELCDVLGVDRPQPAGAETAHNAYVFERAVRPRASETTTAPKRIDLYKKGAFILEAKQSRLPGGKNAIPTQQSLLPDEDLTTLGLRARGPAWDVMMQNARKQAEGYVFLLDADQPAPPFIITCDVGHCLEVFADFTGTGRAYNQFPDRNGFRIFMDDLRNEDVRRRLACIWTDPHSLDPTKTSARVTREIAKRLAEVSKALEARDCNPEDVAHFLMRCLFTMFAEDTDLLPKGSFCDLLQKCVEDPAHFRHRLTALWQQMEKGEDFSHVIEARVRQFNGGLFKDTTVFELGREEIGELLAAAKADWKQVDPAIFGTLLEQALDKEERRRLGAHYTPRTYVHRLVGVTVIEPLRHDWEAALTMAQQARDDGDQKQAIGILRDFHHKLCTTRVLDPACGTGNFLYVSLEMMKQLEGEVLQALTDLGDRQASLAMAGETVDPHQFLGLELNPRAAAIAELVIWIGYLQWHYRNHESHPAEPILRAFKNINFGRREGYDAVLTWDGYPVPSVTVRDGTRVEAFPNARRPEWPAADFIVGNPPFVGNKRMRRRLGDEYVDALRSTSDTVPESADLVMYWWDRGAQLLSARRSSVRRVGLVTTNSITEVYQRRVVDQYLKGKPPISLVFAIPDHPWTKVTVGAAAVRIAITVAQAGSLVGRLETVAIEEQLDTDEPLIRTNVELGRINADLTIGANAADVPPLLANRNIAFRGITYLGAGFVLRPNEAQHLIAADGADEVVRPYISGRDLTGRSRAVSIIDLYGIDLPTVRSKYPNIYSRLADTVRSVRQKDRRQSYRDNWWTFAEPRREFRDSVRGLRRYIAVSQTAKYMTFVFVDIEYLPDQTLVAIANEDSWVLAVLSSSTHSSWCNRLGATLEDRKRYTNSFCFDTFPFPCVSSDVRDLLNRLGSELDEVRKGLLRDRPELTLTALYNLLGKIDAGAALTDGQERARSDGRLVVLRDLHAEIDTVVAHAYGWSADLTEQEIVANLIILNSARIEEEAAGHVEWLRPEYQVPRFAKEAIAKSGELNLGIEPAMLPSKLPAFPTDRYEQPLVIEAMLVAAGHPMSAAELARSFKRGGKRIEQRVAQVLTTLARYGRVTALPDGRFAARRAA